MVEIGLRCSYDVHAVAACRRGGLEKVYSTDFAGGAANEKVSLPPYGYDFTAIPHPANCPEVVRAKSCCRWDGGNRKRIRKGILQRNERVDAVCGKDRSQVCSVVVEWFQQDASKDDTHAYEVFKNWSGSSNDQRGSDVV